MPVMANNTSNTSTCGKKTIQNIQELNLTYTQYTDLKNCMHAGINIEKLFEYKSVYLPVLLIHFHIQNLSLCFLCDNERVSENKDLR